jgi:hypothetical protein
MNSVRPEPTRFGIIRHRTGNEDIRVEYTEVYGAPPATRGFQTVPHQSNQQKETGVQSCAAG